ncbi:MAG: hypothetical protein JJ979_25910 [Roseibium sp.]|nr:hypothetical protein [Roseibium sp.]
MKSYCKDEEQERARQEFYANCAYHFGFENWRVYFHQMKEILPRDNAGATVGGRDGRPSKRVRYGERAKLMEREVNSAPFEWLDQRGIIDEVQADAGHRARADFEGSQVSALKSVAFGDAGGGGFGLRPISDYCIDCQRAVDGLRRGMPPASMKLLEDLLFHDRWLWDGLKAKERKPVYEEIKVALDYAGLYYGLMPVAAFEKKWPTRFPWYDKRAVDGVRELHRSMAKSKATPYPAKEEEKTD